ncbi:uncharacterized protein LOC101856632 [Aplysia californica]|uniref:Uncharacterized protein LOC101856632 n=1 Tax=Aplysia californica TaxID=6500 RepID=A0ABM0KAQ6_APLCA|nr:uncharacterized protein LOC101856632 [Aplysia californica]
MSLPFLRVCNRSLSSSIRRSTPGAPAVDSVFKSSSYSYSSSAPKDTSKSKPAAPKASAKPKKAAESTVPEKGDTYSSGKQFFAHNTYSFYDIESSMAKDRIPQPSSNKMSWFCLDKLNPGNPERPRHFLPEEYGKLEEWPNMDPESSVKEEKPPIPKVKGKYRMPDGTEGVSSSSGTRMPL